MPREQRPVNKKPRSFTPGVPKSYVTLVSPHGNPIAIFIGEICLDLLHDKLDMIPIA